jgi:hypothetical protein
MISRRTELRLLAAIVLSFSFFPPLTAQQQDAQQEADRSKRISDRIEAIVDEALRSLRAEFGYGPSDSSITVTSDTAKIFADTLRPTMTFDGPTTVPAHDTLEATVVVRGGDLTVAGVIRGDVLVVGGSLIVKSGGRIAGNVRVINGDVLREEGGIIEGYIDRTSGKATYREQPESFVLHSYQLRARWAPENTTLDFLVLRYNRVENIFLGLGSDKRYYWDGSRDISLYGSIGYGFKSYNWRGNLGVTRQFAFPNEASGSSHLLEVGLEGHSYTDSKDQWLIDVSENSLAAFFIHEDFRDYYERQGITALAGWYYQDAQLTTQLKVEMNFDEETSMLKRTDWALFGGKKRFRENPAITEGRMRSVVISAGLSSERKSRNGMHGWSLFGTAEFSSASLHSEFSFSLLVLDVKRFQPLGKHDGVNLRVRGGTSAGSLPIQRTFDVGGLGTLPAYSFKDQSGNRMILGNIEYIANGDILGDLDFWPSRVMRHINILIFGDAAWVGIASADARWTQGFEQLTFSAFRSDLGFGFASRNGAFRLAWAWRTDIKAPARFVFRISRPF